MSTESTTCLQLIASYGEQQVQERLAEFRCSKNRVIEHFVRKNALAFTKQGVSVTHLVFRQAEKEQPALVGFFALTYKVLRLSGGSLSRTSEKRIAKFAEYDAATNTYTLPAPLIAQFGKNDLPEGSEPFSGKELMEIAEYKLCDIMAEVGGRAVYLECEDEPKLMQFYESCGYVRAAQRYDKSDETDADTLYHIYVKFLNPAR